MPFDVFVFWVGQYEDAHMVGPFATRAIAQDVLDAYRQYPTFGSWDEPSSEVRALRVQDATLAVLTIAERRRQHVMDYEDD